MRLGLVLAVAMLAGCASLGSSRPEVRPRGQSGADQQRDAAACDVFAREHGAPGEARDRAYAACMVARQYRVTLPVAIAGERGLVDVWATERPSETAALADVKACRAGADGLAGFATCLIARRYVAVPLGRHH